MPETGAQFAPRETLLSFEEITRISRLLASRCGVNDLRVTGGEPLVRKDLPRLIEMLSSIDGVDDLSMTTNGMLLAEFAEPLKRAGLNRLNISLDTLDEERFQAISRRKNVEQVIAGIDAAIDCDFDLIRLNTTAIKGVTEREIVSLVRFALSRNVQIRFIEFMGLDTDRNWDTNSVLSGTSIREIIERSFGKMSPVRPPRDSQPASDFRLDSGQSIGLIQSVTAPFCEACNRIRLTADGSIRNCLFADKEYSLRDAIRDGATNDEIVTRFQDAIWAKKAGHQMQDRSFRPPDRPMYSIGG